MNSDLSLRFWIPRPRMMAWLSRAGSRRLHGKLPKQPRKVVSSGSAELQLARPKRQHLPKLPLRYNPPHYEERRVESREGAIVAEHWRRKTALREGPERFSGTRSTHGTARV